MRLDVWLSKVCLLRSRSQAKSACRGGRVVADGKPLKESHELRGGEILTLSLPLRELRLEVLELPAGNVARRDAPDCYTILSDRRDAP